MSETENTPAPLTEAQLSEIEAEAADLEPNGDGATVLKLIAEIRRLRSLLLEIDTLARWIPDCFFGDHDQDPNGEFVKWDDLEAIRSAIGETPPP